MLAHNAYDWGEFRKAGFNLGRDLDEQEEGHKGDGWTSVLRTVRRGPILVECHPKAHVAGWECPRGNCGPPSHLASVESPTKGDVSAK